MSRSCSAVITDPTRHRSLAMRQRSTRRHLMASAAAAFMVSVTAKGSAPHLAGVAVEQASGATWADIPDKGGSQAILDTMGGQTQVLMNGMLATQPHVQSGKLKTIGVSRATRAPQLPHVPTLAEQGLSGFESGSWQGVLVPAATPPEVVNRLAAELVCIIRTPEISSLLQAQGANVRTQTPTQFAAFYESARWAKVVAAGNIKVN
jgi:tripartite-type tricarboxylate transporter receptor subunit TctC